MRLEYVFDAEKEDCKASRFEADGIFHFQKAVIQAISCARARALRLRGNG